MSDAKKFDLEIQGTDKLTITPDFYVILSVHNEKSDNKDYEQYEIVDIYGQKYVTGSTSFWNAFLDIYEELKDEEEPYSIDVYKIESKNYKGKTFLTCSIN